MPLTLAHSLRYPLFFSSGSFSDRNVFGKSPARFSKTGVNPPVSSHVLSLPFRPAQASSPSEGSSSTSAVTTSVERSEVDILVEGISFGQLCDEFECKSSPSVEATARQLAKDILEMREGNRALGSYALSVQYKDPLRSFKGREKYKRASWIKGALDNPSVAVRDMAMRSTRILNIKWIIRGKLKFPASVFGGDLVLAINATYTLNQISGQVVDHVEEWDLSGSSAIAQVFFLASRLAYATVQQVKDAIEAVQATSKKLQKGKDDDNPTYFRDPSGDPTKFFQTDDNPQRDVYQVGLLIALVYLLVQFLRSTL